MRGTTASEPSPSATHGEGCSSSGPSSLAAAEAMAAETDPVGTLSAPLDGMSQRQIQRISSRLSRNPYQVGMS